MKHSDAVVAALVDNAQRRTGNENVLGDRLLARQIRQHAGWHTLTEDELVDRYREHLNGQGLDAEEVQRRLESFSEGES